MNWDILNKTKARINFGSSEREELPTYFPIPWSWVTCVHSSHKYSWEKRCIIIALFFWRPRVCMIFSISSGATSVAVFASGHTVKSSDMTLLAYNKILYFFKEIDYIMQESIHIHPYGNLMFHTKHKTYSLCNATKEYVHMANKKHKSFMVIKPTFRSEEKSNISSPYHLTYSQKCRI